MVDAESGLAAGRLSVAGTAQITWFLKSEHFASQLFTFVCCQPLSGRWIVAIHTFTSRHSNRYIKYFHRKLVTQKHRCRALP